MKSSHRSSNFGQAGFTLVELMVGMVIGLLASLVILQVMSVFEAQKGTTTGTSDAQTNGSIALYNIGRELQLAGYPLLPVNETDTPLECTTLTVNGVASANSINLTAVSITDGAAGASDTITMRYGTTNKGGVASQITAMGAPTANDATVFSNLGCQVNDTTLVMSGTTCAMSSATAVSAAGVAPITVTLANTTSAVNGANLACLGTWTAVAFRTNNGNLERSVDGGATWNPSVADIVSIQAQYGISAAANSNLVTSWVEPSGATWANPTVANRNLIKAVRIAVVARNAKMEPAAVTAACNNSVITAPTGLCAWTGSVASPAPTISLAASDANWARYRYRVFETIIPLRNVIWSRSTL